jgi:tetratricopeptide (TPR) repeat protein
MATEKDWRVLFDSLSREDWDHAIQMVDSLVREEPNDPTHFLKLGDFFQNKRNWDAAVAAYRKATELYKKEGIYEKAILTLKKILSIKPHDLEVQREITDLLVELKTEKVTPQQTAPLGKHQTVEELKETFLRSELLPEPFRKEGVIMLLQRAKALTFPPQHRIIREGDTDRTVYIIMKGSVEVKTYVKDEEIRLAVLLEGDIFGEIAFLTLSPRTASVISLTEVSLLVLTQELLEKMIRQEPIILKYLYDLYKSRK